MQGEYRGDFTRDTFKPENHFSRVLLQQGRVQLDADWNEQTSIVLHYLRSLGRTLLGQHGGPDDDGFGVKTIDPQLTDLQIGSGSYYVDGILCEAGPDLTYKAQPVPPGSDLPPLKDGLLIYLDVWERHVTSVQQNSLREVALGGPDTATRAKVVWQVKVATETPGKIPWPTVKLDDSHWKLWVDLWQPANRGQLKAWVRPQKASTDACVISPESRYRRAENQLYRVEIHQGGVIGPGAAAAPSPSFKWSRENSSVSFQILKLTTSATQTLVTLATLGRDRNLGLKLHDWVEVADDHSSFSGLPTNLLQVADIDPDNRIVTLAGTPGFDVADPSQGHPILRRWEGTAPISEDNGSSPGIWLPLEDGIEIQFPQTAPVAQYRHGDYWLIPARVATGDIEWPQVPGTKDGKSPVPQPPHGVEHHYAPLAVLTPIAGPSKVNVVNLRRIFQLVAKI